MLNTTPDRDFGRDVDPIRLLYNHGVHGLQDLALVLRRFDKPYQVIAGHFGMAVENIEVGDLAAAVNAISDKAVDDELWNPSDSTSSANQRCVPISKADAVTDLQAGQPRRIRIEFMQP